VTQLFVLVLVVQGEVWILLANFERNRLRIIHPIKLLECIFEVLCPTEKLSSDTCIFELEIDI